jgi:hypothetical protein
MRQAVLPGLFLLVSLAGACRNPVAPDDPNLIKVNGTMRFMTFEGGFWVVRGDDNVSYDPVNELPAGFQVEGLRVHLEAKRRGDLGGFHMAGPLVEIIRITKLP